MKIILAKAALILTITLVFSGMARAQNWSGASSTDWNTAGNWSSSTVPGATNTATFASTTGLQTTVNLSASDTIHALSFSASAPAYTITTSPGQTLTIDVNSTGSATLITQASSGVTETINGAATITNSNNTTTNTLLSLTGNLTFGTSSSLSITQDSVATTSSTGNLSINGALSIASGLGINWNPTSGILYYNPSSQSVTGTSLRSTSAAAGAIYLQQGFTGSSIVIGGTGALVGAVYFNANGVNETTGITMNATTTGKGAGTYIFGANASGSAAMTQTGNISIGTVSGNSSTDQFDVAANNTLTVTGTINGSNSGNGTTLLKTGTGTLALAHTNTYVAATSVTGGTLMANASGATGTNAVSVIGTSASATATLGGNGSITSGATSNTVTIGAYGVLAPGGLASVGDQIDTLTLNMTGTTLAAGTAYLSFTSPTAALSFNLGSDNQSSLLSLTGSAAGRVSFDGNTVNFTDLTPGTLSLGTYTLITSDAASVFSGLTLGTDGKTIMSGLSIGTGLSAYTSAGDIASLEVVGDNIILSLASVPEPSTVWLLAASILGCVWMRRRRILATR